MVFENINCSAYGHYYKLKRLSLFYARDGKKLQKRKYRNLTIGLDRGMYYSESMQTVLKLQIRVLIEPHNLIRIGDLIL